MSNERELIVSSFLQDISKEKESSLKLICNTHTPFLLCEVEMSMCVCETVLFQSMGGKRFILVYFLYQVV